MNKLLFITILVFTQPALILADSGIGGGGGGPTPICPKFDVKTTISCDFKNNKEAEFTYIGIGNTLNPSCRFSPTPPTNNRSDIFFSMDVLANNSNIFQGNFQYEKSFSPSNTGRFCDGVISYDRNLKKYVCSGRNYFEFALLGKYQRYLGNIKMIVVDRHGTIADKNEFSICDYIVQRIQ